MSLIHRAQRRLFDYILCFQSDDLLARYGDEIREVFHEQLNAAWGQGPLAIVQVWSGVLAEAVELTVPRYVGRLRLLLVASVLASALTLGTALGFCTLDHSPVVHASAQDQSSAQNRPPTGAPGGLVQLSNGRKMFLECSGDPDAGPTVILANGRGLGTADSWAQVQAKIPSSIRNCSYDAMGAGRSDKFEESHSIDQVLTEMHDLFESARLRKPYVLVGASAGGILVRRYQQSYPREIAGLVFVDSSHEEMEWRDAAISKDFDPKWNDPVNLRENGFLPDQQKLTWRADIPLIVLERSEKVPSSAFPDLTPQQLDAINAAWHNYQVDLAGRSMYGKLRIVAGSGHRMHQERPDAIAEAIKVVTSEVRQE